VSIALVANKHALTLLIGELLNVDDFTHTLVHEIRFVFQMLYARTAAKQQPFSHALSLSLSLSLARARALSLSLSLSHTHTHIHCYIFADQDVTRTHRSKTAVSPDTGGQCIVHSRNVVACRAVGELPTILK